MKKIVVVVLVLSASIVFGGQCSICNSRVLGHSSLCSSCKLKADSAMRENKEKNRVNTGNLRFESTNSRASSVSPPKFKLEEIKYPKVKSNPYFAFCNDSREWKSQKTGAVINGIWQVCSEDGKTIYIKDPISDKDIRVSVSALIPSDQRFVSDLISAMKKMNLIWWEGGYFSASEIKYIKRAEELVLKRSSLVPSHFKVFQVLDYGALARFGEVSSSGNVFYTGSAFLISQDVDGLVSDSEELYQQLFWATTYDYINKVNEHRTVDRYTTSFPRAVNYVRAKMKWYDKDDMNIDYLQGLIGGGGTSTGTPIQPGKQLLDPSKAELSKTGSGFFVSNDGYIITNNHVIDGGVRFRALTSSGTEDAVLVKRDVDTDLALLKINKKTKASVFSRARIEKLGSEIFTMGFPQPGLQGFSPKVTKGVISGIEGFKGDVKEYQIDASIQPGNSGGPLYDANGYIVGVLVATLNGGQSVNYAIKKTYLMAFLDSIPECSYGIQESTEGNSIELYEAVEKVRDSCVLVLTYQ